MSCFEQCRSLGGKSHRLHVPRDLNKFEVQEKFYTFDITFAIKLYVRTKRLGNSIFVKSNIKLCVEFTNGNLS